MRSVICIIYRDTSLNESFFTKYIFDIYWLTDLLPLFMKSFLPRRQKEKYEKSLIGHRFNYNVIKKYQKILFFE